VVRAERAESVKAAGHRKGLAVVSKLCNNSWYYTVVKVSSWVPHAA
jgi:hypothetical protein